MITAGISVCCGRQSPDISDNDNKQVLIRDSESQGRNRTGNDAREAPKTPDLSKGVDANFKKDIQAIRANLVEKLNCVSEGAKNAYTKKLNAIDSYLAPNESGNGSANKKNNEFLEALKVHSRSTYIGVFFAPKSYTDFKAALKKQQPQASSFYESLKTSLEQLLIRVNPFS